MGSAATTVAGKEGEKVADGCLDGLTLVGGETDVLDCFVVLLGGFADVVDAHAGEEELPGKSTGALRGLGWRAALFCPRKYLGAQSRVSERASILRQHKFFFFSFSESA